MTPTPTLHYLSQSFRFKSRVEVTNDLTQDYESKRFITIIVPRGHSQVIPFYTILRQFRGPGIIFHESCDLNLD